MFAWLKRLSPRGIYGRAALILIVPIVTIQLVVSLAFIQRHFEDVTRQMTRNIVLEISAVLKAGEGEADPAGALRAMSGPAGDLSLEVMAGSPAGREIDPRAFYDLSGNVVIETLREAFPDTLSVDLSADRRVALTVAAGPGLIGGVIVGLTTFLLIEKLMPDAVQGGRVSGALLVASGLYVAAGL